MTKAEVQIKWYKEFCKHAGWNPKNPESLSKYCVMMAKLRKFAKEVKV